MIPLKVFNALPPNKRLQIARIVFGHMGDNFINQMATPFQQKLRLPLTMLAPLLLQEASELMEMIRFYLLNLP